MKIWHWYIFVQFSTFRRYKNETIRNLLCTKIHQSLKASRQVEQVGIAIQKKVYTKQSAITSTFLLDQRDPLTRACNPIFVPADFFDTQYVITPLHFCISFRYQNLFNQMFLIIKNHQFQFFSLVLVFFMTK